MTAATSSRCAAAALSLAGMALATYLSVEHVTGGAPACGVSGGCADVTSSEYAVLLGVPVAFIGVAGYGAMLLGTLAYLGLDGPPSALSHALLGMALIGEGLSGYFVYTQAFRIHTYCAYCLTSAAIMSAVLVVTIYATVMSSSNGNARPSRGDMMGSGSLSQGPGIEG